MGPIIQDVQYTVPVCLSIEKGRIVRVVVDDEAAEFVEEISSEVLSILESQEWPAWEFGL